MRSTINEHGEGVPLDLSLRDLSPEERKLTRKELAELGELLARVERRRKALAGDGGWGAD
jgi:hypothetical protein